MAFKGAIYVITLLAVLKFATSLDWFFITDPRTPRAHLVFPDPNFLRGLQEFTVCAHVNVNSKATNEMTILSYSSKEVKQAFELVLTVKPEAYTKCIITGTPVTFPELAPASDEWGQICVTFKRKGDVKLYINGELADSQEAPEKIRALGGYGSLDIGQQQYSYDHDYYNVKDGMHGGISQVKIWNRVLTDEEVEAAFNCEMNSKGLLLDSATATWLYKDNAICRAPTDDSPCGDLVCDGGYTMTDVDSCSKPQTASYDLQEGNTMLKNGRKVTVTAKLEDEVPACDHMTFCFWFFHGRGMREDFKAASMSSAYEEDYVAYRPESNNNCFSIGGVGVGCETSALKKGDWNHHCFVWSSEGGTLKEYLNGKPVKTHADVSDGYTTPEDGKLFVKQIQSKPADPSNPIIGFTCKITDINIYNRVLDSASIAQLCDCTGSVPGDPINWYSSRYNITTS